MRNLLAAIGVIAIIGVVGGVLVGAWVYRNVDARLLLSNQPATVIIPEPLRVSAKVLNNLDIELDTRITTTVPIDQVIRIPIAETLNVMADFDGDVPIKMTVPIKDKIAIDQILDIDTVIQAEMLGDKHDLPLRGKIPVKAVVPISLNIPVDQMVRLKFRAPVQARLRQALTVPLKADIATTIPIKSQMSVPVKSALDAMITIPDPADIVIVESDLLLPLRTLVLGATGNPAPGPAPVPAAAAR